MPEANGKYTVTAKRAATTDTLGDTATATVTASQVASHLTVEPTPASVKGGDPVTIRARLQREDGRNGDVKVQLIAIDEAGARRDHFAATDADGYVKFTDTPATAGTTDYTVRYWGDGSPAVRYLPAQDQRFPVTVDAHTPLLELRTDRARYDAGQNATIDVDVTGSETRHVVVTAKRAVGDPRVLFDGAVPAGGLELTRTMRYSETIKVHHPADARHEGQEASLWRGVRLGLKTTASRSADRIGNYAVYQRSADPTFVTSTSPRRPEVCVQMQLQKYGASAWRHVKTSVCRTTGDLGKSRWTLTGRQATGVKFRTRSTFAGDPLNTASRSSSYFRFR